MNNIYLNIVANAQFQQVYAEVAKLKEAMLTLQKTSVGGPFTPANVSSIKASQAAFDSAILSTRAFNIEQVAMTSNTEKFGKALSSGRLGLNQYYNLWRQGAKGTSAELDALATSQARLNRSIAIADPLRPGYAKLVTDINGVVTAEEKAVFYQRALNTAIQQGSIKLIDFGKNMQWAGRQMTVGLTMPMAMFAAGTASMFYKFDEQMTSMLKVYGAHATVQSQATLDAIRKDVTNLAKELAHTMGTTMSDTVEIAKTFSSIGLEGKNLLTATEATARLAKLGDVSVQQASTAMVSVQNIFKLQASQVTQAVDFLNAAKHSTSTTMQDITDALPRVGPIIQQMGGTYKDFATFLVAMKESGIPAAQGANAIKSMMASLLNPTTKAAAAFQSMGINLDKVVKNNKGNLVGMINDLNAGLNKLPAEQKLKAIEQLFGKFQFARVSALLSNMGSSTSQAAKVLELYGQTDAQLAAVAKQEIDVASKGTPAARFQKMKASLTADLIPIGQTFLEVFTKIGNVIDKIVSAFNKLGIIGKGVLAGLAAAAILGPIIMLVGLFSNLAGQVLKGLNYIRMFKQGMDNALPSQNKFAAGIHGMRNFYQELDKSTIAARNQMDLMPEAITSNAKAFEILSASIETLTNQFRALAVAQSEAMGIGGVPMAGGSIGPSPFKIPFRAPGHIDGAVGLTGGTPGTDSIPAMLAPGESVMTAEATAKYGGIFQAMNAGEAIPGFITGRVGSGPSGRIGKSGATVVRPYGANVSATAGLESFGALEATSMADITSLYAKQIAAEAEVSIGAINREILTWQNANKELIDSAAAAVRSGISADEAYAGLIEKFNADMESANGPFNQFTNSAKEMAPRLQQDLMQAQQAAEELNLNMHKAADAAALAAAMPENMIAQSMATPGNFQSLSRTRVGAAAYFGGAEGLGTYGVPRFMTPQGLHPSDPLYKQASSQEHLSTTIAQQANLERNKVQRAAAQAAQELVTSASVGMQEGVRTAAGMHSPATEEIAMGENLVTSFNSGIESELGATRQAGVREGEAVIEGVEETAGGAKAAGSFSMGKMGGSMAMMMGGSMVGGAVGGAAGSSISTGTMLGSMGLMMGKSMPMVAGLTALGAAIPLVTDAFKKMAEDTRAAANEFKAGFQVSTQAIEYFGVKFTPMAQYDYSSVTASLGKHIQSIKDNKAAVDALTSAYMNATDQFTKDYIKQLKKEDPQGLKFKMQEKYNTDLASGMTSKQALQDITSIMNAVGINSYQQNNIRASMDQKSTSVTGFQKTLSTAANVTGGSAATYQVGGGGFAIINDPNAGGIKPGDKRYVQSKLALEAIRTTLINLGGVNTKTFDDIVKNMDSTSRKTLNTDQVYRAFAKTVSVGSKNMQDFTANFRKANGTTVQLSEATRLLNAKLVSSDDILTAIKNNKFDKTWTDNLDKLLALENASGNGKGNGSGNGNGYGTTPDYSKQFAPLLKQYNGILKLVQDQTNAQKKYNDQLKQTQDYHMKQMDYFNQMKMAFTSGNYLGAMMAQTGAKTNQADFKAQMQDAKNQDTVQNLQDLIARITDGQSSGKSLSSFLKDNKIFTTSVDNVNWQKQLFGGVDKKTFTTNTGGIIAKANAAAASGTAAASQGAFQTLVVNVSADNSVVPETFASTVATKVLQAQKTAQAKTAASNAVGARGVRP